LSRDHVTGTTAAWAVVDGPWLETARQQPDVAAQADTSQPADHEV
jgi:hypothetical protein